MSDNKRSNGYTIALLISVVVGFTIGGLLMHYGSKSDSTWMKVVAVLFWIKAGWSGVNLLAPSAER